MNFVNKINKQIKYCLQNQRRFSCEVCPIRTLAIYLKKVDPAEIRTCLYFITDKKFSHYFKDVYSCGVAIKRSLILIKKISTNKI